MAILTTRTVADFIGVDEAENMTPLARLRDAAQKRAEAFCGYAFDFGTHTEYYDALPNNGGIVYTKHRPIVALFALTDSAQDGPRAINTNNDVHWDYDDYKASGRVELWNTESDFVAGRRAILVSYSAGWTTANAPADLVQALCEIIAAKWEGTEALSRSAQNVDGVQITWRAEDIPPQAFATLCAYKHWLP